VTPRRFLTVSFLFNLALAGLIAYRFYNTPSSPAAVTPPPPQSPRTVVKTVHETNEVVQPGSIVRQDWLSVEHEDYRKYIANLRAIGCPEETIRDIIILDINKIFMDQWRKSNPSKQFKYWETRVDNSEGRNSEERERTRAQLEFNLQKKQLVRDLLGVDLTEELAKYHMSNSRADLENMWTFISSEKREIVRQIQSRYTDAVAALRAQADPDGRLSPELIQQLRDLRVRTETELAQSMTPTEFEQYQLRMSPTATNVRLALSAFDPTEDEYKRIFPIRKEYDDKYSDLDRTDPDQAKQRAEGVQIMDDKIQAVLSPERFADYRRNRDNDYRDAFQFVKLWELPKDTINTLYEAKKAVDDRVREIRADTSLNDTTRRAQLAQAQAQAQQTLKGALGDRAFQGYLRGRGSWLRTIAR